MIGPGLVGVAMGPLFGPAATPILILRILLDGAVAGIPVSIWTKFQHNWMKNSSNEELINESNFKI